MAATQYTLLMENTLSDEQLMANYRDGDVRAFDELYMRHKGSLFRYILRQCRQPGITDELFQDVWMKLIHARQRYVVKARFKTYLYQIARNHVIDYFRKNKLTSITAEGEQVQSMDDFPSNSQVQPDCQLEQQQAMERLIELIDRLPFEQREAFLLKEEAGMNLSEIAELTGVSMETAKSRLRYALKKLRGNLGPSI